MAHVDAMSRAPVELPCEVDDVSANIMMIDISNEDLILTMQQQDANLQQIIDILKRRIDSTQREQHEKEFILKGNWLYGRHHDGKDLLVIPKGIRWRIVRLCHDDASHPGVDDTIKHIKQHFWFPRCRNFVKEYIKSCVECCYNRSTAKKECQLYGIEIPRVPFEVPVGFKGTVVGIHTVTDSNPVRLEYVKTVENFYEILFDKSFTGGNDIYGLAPGHVSKVPESSLLLIIPDNCKIRGQAEQNLQPFDNENCVAFRDTSKNIDAKSIQKNKNFQKKSSNYFWTPIHSLPANSNEFWTPTQTDIVHEVTKNNQSSKASAGTDLNFGIRFPENTSLGHFTHSYQPSTQESTQFKIMKKTIQKTPNVEIDYNSKTNALKFLLGIHMDKTFENCEKFKQLPQPPRCWKDSLNITTYPKSSEICFNSQHVESRNVRCSSLCNAQIFSQVSNTAVLPYVQKYSCNNTHENSIKVKQHNTNIPVQTMHVTYTLDKNTDKINSSNISGEKNLIKLKKTEKPYRTPKIAAKFDNTYSSNLKDYE
ncbi:uncharacterized protein LOC119688549 [Teleopsis dalmanni]|uniref:uncharacterized protein LOC119688549 n=1 Tax=Teleopsis dalmanni TaxID=139649 RepID=UPI0018CF5147|nr:uncharacterized protein LOC119688549 [Teleopsis dalmanni]